MGNNSILSKAIFSEQKMQHVPVYIYIVKAKIRQKFKTLNI